jgi:hypothetical protein
MLAILFESCDEQSAASICFCFLHVRHAQGHAAQRDACVRGMSTKTHTQNSLKEDVGHARQGIGAPILAARPA